MFRSPLKPVLATGFVLAGTLVAGSPAAIAATAQLSNAAAAGEVVYAAPAAGSTSCTVSDPCGITQAQTKVRSLLSANRGTNIEVRLADGVYRLAATLEFTAADSPSAGSRVTWNAAPGAHPVFSGADVVTGWTLRDAAKNIWSATVPAGSNTRQVYVNGVKAPIATTTPAEQGISFSRITGGYNISNGWPGAIRDKVGAAAFSDIEFVYTAGNGPWTESRCRVNYASTGSVTMQDPCWNNVTNRPTFRNASGALPSMDPGRTPSRIENASAFLHPGQWYLDRGANRLDYIPAAGQDINTVKIELPRLTNLVKGAGTLDAPVANLTFSGITFSDATWNDPSTTAGFAEVQDNLRLTIYDPTKPQATCEFTEPVGTCPFGSLTRPPGNVQFHAAQGVNFVGNTFTRMGSSALVFEYGAKNNLIQGNTFRDLSSGAFTLGDTIDPHPSDVGETDREISTDNTFSDNYITKTGLDYPGAAAVTLFFTQRTKVNNNELVNVSYTGISAGVIQGHVNDRNHPYNSTNINSDNQVSNNVFRGFMEKLHDGGAIYVEGQQGQEIKNQDGSINRAESIKHGLTAQGNVAFDQAQSNFTWYDDAGVSWMQWIGNVEWGSSERGQGGCAPVGHIDVVRNYSENSINQWACGTPVDISLVDNTELPELPGVGDLPATILAAAGPRPEFRAAINADGPDVSYVKRSIPTPQGTPVLLAGGGFTPDTQVSFAGTPAAQVTVVSPSILEVLAAPGSDTSKITVTTPFGTTTEAAPPVNVSDGKPATQSSTYDAGYEAGQAVDGSFGNFSDTNKEAQPWWQVDLQKSYKVQEIDIYNRNDCCSDRLADFWVMVSNNPFTDPSLDANLARSDVWKYHQVAAAGRPTKIEVPSSNGRYVRIQLVGTNELALAEVQVLVSDDSVVPVASTGAVHYWPFDETSGSTVTDLITGQAATLNAGSTLVPAKVNGGVHLDGVTSGFATSAAPVKAPWTAGLWVKRNGSDVAGTLLAGSTAAIKLEQYGASQRVGMTIYGVEDLSVDYVTPLSQWVYLTFVGSAASTTVYADGVAVGRMNKSIPLGLDWIGRTPRDSAADRATADIDDLVVIDRAYTAEEVAALAASATKTKKVADASVTVTRTDGSDPVGAGDSIALKASVTSTGLVDMRDAKLTVSDDSGSPKCTTETVTATGTWDCTWTHTVTADEATQSSLSFTATFDAIGTNSAATPVHVVSDALEVPIKSTTPVDTDGPVLTVTKTPATPNGLNGWYTTPVKVSASASDVSGVQSLEFRYDSGSWMTYTGELTPALGTTVISFRAIDTLGNVSTDVAAINFDNVKPVSTIKVKKNSATKSTMTLAGTDAHSGIGKLTYRIDAGPWKTYTGPVVVTMKGQHAVLLYATDKAGNVEATHRWRFTVG